MRRSLDDLPVAVELGGVLGEEVSAYVESEAGWQVVADGGPPRPVLAITDAARPGTPCVVVVEGQPEPAQVRAALLEGALDVLGWPDDRERLLEVPLRASAAQRDGSGPAVLGVAAAAGGAGASTVALACGGLMAWSGRDVIVVGDQDLLTLCGVRPWTGPGAAEVAALEPAEAAAEVDALARPVPGVDRLRVLGGGAASVTTAGWPAAVVVVDLRAPRPADGPLGRGFGEAGRPSWPGRVDLLVVRPDAGVHAAAGTPEDVPVVLVGDGPLDRAGVRRALGRAPVGRLPASVRVARAGVAGRVPSGLPGSWLASLRTTLERVRR